MRFEPRAEGFEDLARFCPLAVERTKEYRTTGVLHVVMKAYGEVRAVRDCLRGETASGVAGTERDEFRVMRRDCPRYILKLFAFRPHLSTVHILCRRRHIM